MRVFNSFVYQSLYAKKVGCPLCILESIAKRLYNAQQGNPLDMSCPLCLVVLLKLAIYRV